MIERQLSQAGQVSPKNATLSSPSPNCTNSRRQWRAIFVLVYWSCFLFRCCFLPSSTFAAMLYSALSSIAQFFCCFEKKVFFAFLTLGCREKRRYLLLERKVGATTQQNNNHCFHFIPLRRIVCCSCSQFQVTECNTYDAVTTHIISLTDQL